MNMVYHCGREKGFKRISVKGGGLRRIHTFGRTKFACYHTRKTRSLSRDMAMNIVDHCDREKGFNLRGYQ